jgi:hypothetical protein
MTKTNICDTISPYSLVSETGVTGEGEGSPKKPTLVLPRGLTNHYRPFAVGD